MRTVRGSWRPDGRQASFLYSGSVIRAMAGTSYPSPFYNRVVWRLQNGVAPCEVDTGLTSCGGFNHGALRSAFRRRANGILPCWEPGKQPRTLSDGLENLVALVISNLDSDITQIIAVPSSKNDLQVIFFRHLTERLAFTHTHSAAHVRRPMVGFDRKGTIGHSKATADRYEAKRVLRGRLSAVRD